MCSTVYPLRSVPLIFVRLLKEPLGHFLLIGVALFLIFDLINPNSAQNPEHIQIDRDKLLTFMQHRAKSFNASDFSERLDQLPPAQLQGLIDDYSREEALYREAKALSLDANDNVARQRLIQQVTYITRGFIDAGARLSDAQLQNYFQANHERYREPGKITFTHVFFSFDRHNTNEALKLARKTLDTLNKEHIPFHRGLAYGERFLYHANYVNKEADLVASHFGSAMQAELFELAPSDQTWRGPFVSTYGAHLVMATGRSQDYDPPLAEVRDRVYQDAQQSQAQANLQEAIAAIVSAYKIVLPADLELRLNAAKNNSVPQAEKASVKGSG